MKSKKQKEENPFIYRASDSLREVRYILQKKSSFFSQQQIALAVEIDRCLISDMECCKPTTWDTINALFGYYSLYIENIPVLYQAYLTVLETQSMTMNKWRELNTLTNPPSNEYDARLWKKIQKAQEIDLSRLVKQYAERIRENVPDKLCKRSRKRDTDHAQSV